MSGLSQKKSADRAPSVVVSNSTNSKPTTTTSPTTDVNFDQLDQLMNEFSTILSQTQGKSQIGSQPSSSGSKFVSSTPSVTAVSSTAPSSSSSSSSAKPIQNSVSYGINFDELKLGKQIGKGNFGVVYQGLYKGKTVAIKELFDTEDTNIEKYYQREIEMLR